jgi:hypothetical protein
VGGGKARSSKPPEKVQEPNSKERMLWEVQGMRLPVQPRPAGSNQVKPDRVIHPSQSNRIKVDQSAQGQAGLRRRKCSLICGYFRLIALNEKKLCAVYGSTESGGRDLNYFRQLKNFCERKEK